MESPRFINSNKYSEGINTIIPYHKNIQKQEIKSRFLIKSNNNNIPTVIIPQAGSMT